jgi:SPP1 gp7 family putative phage head morphogenesis protein
MRARQPVQKAYHRAIKKCLIKAEMEVLTKLQAAQVKSMSGLSLFPIPYSPLRRRAVAADFIFNLRAFAQGMRVGMRAVGASALDTAGQQANDELGLPSPFRFPPQAAVEFLAARQNRLKDVPEGIWQRIHNVISEGLESGKPLAQVAKEIAANVSDEFDAIGEGRAMVIARTETLTAYGAGRHEAFRQAGIKRKRWLTAGDDRVRPDHAEANGQIVPRDEPFQIAGYPMDFPGDDSQGAPLNEIINCRCVSVAERPKT